MKKQTSTIPTSYLSIDAGGARETEGDIVRCALNVHTESIVPIFYISNVTGEGLDNVKEFLNLLPRHKHVDQKTPNTEFHIDQTWSVTGVGTVVGGHLLAGKIKVGDRLMLGPVVGKYRQVIIRSLQCKRVPLQEVMAGSYVTVGLRNVQRDTVRKGNVLISDIKQHTKCTTFVARVKVLRSHSTTIRVGYEPVMHLSSVRTSVKLKKIRTKTNARNPKKTIDDDVLRTGDIAMVELTFRYDTEFIKPGMQILLCEGHTKVVGSVEELLT